MKDISKYFSAISLSINATIFMQENVVIKYTRNLRINATIFMQEYVLIKYTRNRCINATISCIFFYGVKVYMKYTHDYAGMCNIA